MLLTMSVNGINAECSIIIEGPPDLDFCFSDSESEQKHPYLELNNNKRTIADETSETSGSHTENSRNGSIKTRINQTKGRCIGTTSQKTSRLAICNHGALVIEHLERRMQHGMARIMFL